MGGWISSVFSTDTNSLDHLVVKCEVEFTPYVNYNNEEIEPDWTESFTREWKGIAVDELGEYLDDYAVSGSTASQVVGEDMESNLFSTKALNIESKK